MGIALGLSYVGIRRGYTYYTEEVEEIKAELLHKNGLDVELGVKWCRWMGGR